MKATEGILGFVGSIREVSVAEKKHIRLVFVECEEPAESAPDKAGGR